MGDTKASLSPGKNRVFGDLSLAGLAHRSNFSLAEIRELGGRSRQIPADSFKAGTRVRLL